jgi:DNA-binding GntR family transcriptional regulator
MGETNYIVGMTGAGTVTHRSLKDLAAAHIRELILTGKLAPGAKVDQDQISESLGISRLPVREALIELAQESLIDAVPRRGAFVARLEREDIIDHYRIYGLIAGLAASRAANSIRPEELAELRNINASFAAAATAQEKADLNHEFHKRINQAGGSRQLSSVLRLLSRSLPVRYFEFVPQWAEISAGHHARILSALEAGDAYEVQRMVEYHLAESGELAVEILQEMGYWDRASAQPADASESGAA